jgi:hypothetical protein
MVGPYFDSDHYQDTHEAEVERKLEEKWYAFKYFIKGALKQIWIWKKR